MLFNQTAVNFYTSFSPFNKNSSWGIDLCNKLSYSYKTENYFGLNIGINFRNRTYQIDNILYKNDRQDIVEFKRALSK